MNPTSESTFTENFESVRPKSHQWQPFKETFRKLINEKIEIFENNRVQYAAYKRSVSKGEQGQAPGSQSHHAKYVENSVSHLMVQKAICVNRSNLLLRIL